MTVKAPIPIVMTAEWLDDGQLPVITRVRRMTLMERLWFRLKRSLGWSRPAQRRTEKAYDQIIGVEASVDAYEMISHAVANRCAVQLLQVLPPEEVTKFDTEDKIKL